MDRIDRALLGALEREGRLSYADLGERVGLSKTPCWKRVQVLEDQGVIQGYRAVLDPLRLGLEVLAFVQITVAFESHEAFERVVTKHPRIVSAYATLGEADYLLQVLMASMGELDLFLRQDLWRLPGVQRFTTRIGTRTIKANTPLVSEAARG